MGAGLSRHVLVLGDARRVDWSALPSPDLVLTDPPWLFQQANGKPPPYPGMPTPEIVGVLVQCGAFRAHVGFAMWVTGAHFGEFIEELVRRRLPLPVTLGAWDKGGADYGQGAWWASRMEFLLRWSGGHADRSRLASNGVSTPKQSHSEKPVRWQADLIHRWAPDDGVVLDPFLGLGTTLRAVHQAGGQRRFVGVELVPKRFEAAIEAALLAGVTGIGVR